MCSVPSLVSLVHGGVPGRKGGLSGVGWSDGAVRTKGQASHHDV